METLLWIIQRTIEEYEYNMNDGMFEIPDWSIKEDLYPILEEKITTWLKEHKEEL